MRITGCPRSWQIWVFALAQEYTYELSKDPGGAARRAQGFDSQVHALKEALGGLGWPSCLITWSSNTREIGMYYSLTWKVSPTDPTLANTGEADDVGVAWTMGLKNEVAVPEPLRCKLNPARGRRMRDMFLVDVPLFSTRMLQALASVGVRNLETYAAEIQSPEGEVYENYRAVNIVGLVSCANMQLSQYLPDTEPPLVEFLKLVIDESRAMDQDLFRLAESALYILVSEKVRAALLGAQLVGIALEPVASS